MLLSDMALCLISLSQIPLILIFSMQWIHYELEDVHKNLFVGVSVFIIELSKRREFFLRDPVGGP